MKLSSLSIVIYLLAFTMPVVKAVCEAEENAGSDCVTTELGADTWETCSNCWLNSIPDFATDCNDIENRFCNSFRNCNCGSCTDEAIAFTACAVNANPRFDCTGNFDCGGPSGAIPRGQIVVSTLLVALGGSASLMAGA